MPALRFDLELTAPEWASAVNWLLPFALLCFAAAAVAVAASAVLHGGHALVAASLKKSVVLALQPKNTEE